MRLFAGVWPADEVLPVLSAFERPDLAAVRWTRPDQWHVTLVFLGEVADEDLEEVTTALAHAASRVAAAPEADLGPATARFGPGVLGVPVHGLEEAAAAVRDALATMPGISIEARPYAGHLTLARAIGRRKIPPPLVGLPLRARWKAQELCLVASTLTARGARYTTLARATVPS